MMTKIQQPIYQWFADLLEYPSANLLEIGRDRCQSVTQNYPQVAENLSPFVSFIENTSGDRIEELYTITFDLNPVCYPYPGFHLFGESYKRGEFLAKLKQRYREYDFEAGNELADHLTVLLRFMATLPSDSILLQELIQDCLQPALAKMQEGFKNQNPYAGVIAALQKVLVEIPQIARV